MATASLAEAPKSAAELEEYVAALFHAGGYFVEKNITERDFTEILELDAVATHYEDSLPVSVMAEAKSGRWGFSDIFKVVGWMRYLDIVRGGFFVAKVPTGFDIAAAQTKLAPLGVALVDLGDFAKAREAFGAAGFLVVKDDLLVTIWRFSCWAERRLIEVLRSSAKSSGLKGPRVAFEYHRLVNDGIFFVKDIQDRLAALYQAYQGHPKLSLGVAEELDGQAFDPDMPQPDNPKLREALLFGEHKILQSCFYVEHRARLAILKAAVDYVCMTEGGQVPGKLRAALPATFRDGVDQLRKDRAFRRYALFWQVFLWGHGGFYLKDRQAAEFQWLQEQTGVPEDEIPNALQAFDVLFPIDGGWLTQLGAASQCVIVKMMPAPLRGIGAYHRLRRYGVKDYHELGYGDYTERDLTRWQNRLVDLLAP